MMIPLLFALSLSGADPGVAATSEVTLDEAVRVAREKSPALRQQSLNTGIAGARETQVRAPLWPQLRATASYQRSTSNVAGAPGSGVAATTKPSFDSQDFFSSGLTVSQSIVDVSRWADAAAAGDNADAAAYDEAAAGNDLVFAVRSAFYLAAGQRDLVDVADEAVANAERQLATVQAQVDAGLRAAIDLAQAKTDVENARAQREGARSAAQSARLELGRLMGTGGAPTPAPTTPAATPAEALSSSALLQTALSTRAELKAQDARRRAADANVWGAWAGYAPTLSASLSTTAAGRELDALAPNGAIGVQLSIPIFDGWATPAAVDEARLLRESADAAREGLVLAISADVEAGVFAVKAAIAQTQALDAAVESARTQLSLAESRYQTGIGTVLELSTARLQLTTTAAQQVQAQTQLGVARAQLLRAVGSG